MVQPISLLMAHFNVEHSAQISKDAIAAAQQTGQGQQVVQESVRRTQTVQANQASAEMQKVHRRNEDEERERRRERREERATYSPRPQEQEEELLEASHEELLMPFDLYA